MFEVKFGDEPLCEQYMVWTFMARNQYSSYKFNGSLEMEMEEYQRFQTMISKWLKSACFDYPVGIYFFKFNVEKNRALCEIVQS